MARKRKKSQTEPARYVPTEDLVRKTFATALIQEGHLLSLMVNSLKAINQMDGVRAFSSKEHQYLDEATECLERAQKICLVIGRRNQRA